MNTIRQFKSKLPIRIVPVIEIGSEFVRDMWLLMLAEREARIRLMTDGHLDRQYEPGNREESH